ncbi:unnamed protein product [Onchocerca flexuosa]|uniref:Reverse transcriptase domain-containing protein n=1 Tax=Onchocerca flexuosa TaxID=387005 RepID=A0A183HN28_9BILA|nr:unnamed protein product [Onchocerca flexuosa]
MGDICSSNDPMKSVMESTVSNIINDAIVNNQTQSKGVKMETKSTGTKKTQTKRPSDDFRRHVNGTSYGGQSRRNSVNNGGYNGTNLRRSTSSTLNSRTRQISNETSRATDPENTVDNAGNANQRTATAESQKKCNSYAHAHAFRYDANNILKKIFI